MELCIKEFQELTAAELYEILKLRVDVFVVEQNCPYHELDDKDQRALHVLLRDAQGIAAYLRVLAPGVSFEEAAIGRVIAARRRAGLGTRVLRAGIRAAKARFGADTIRIEAQSYAKAFYEKQGFVQVSDEFLEDGIPHIQMLYEPIDFDALRVEVLDEADADGLRGIDRSDIDGRFVDSADTLLENLRYGFAHACIGHAFAVRYRGEMIGFLLLGEALAWESDPPQMRREAFYRLMGFVIDRRFRNRGIGAYALEAAIARCYADFGVRPIALGVHKENVSAAAFYQRHGFEKTQAQENDDIYYLRYPV